MRSATFVSNRWPSATSPLADDEILVKSPVCVICGTDLHEYIGGPIMTPATPLPFCEAEMPPMLGYRHGSREGRVLAHI